MKRRADGVERKHSTWRDALPKAWWWVGMLSCTWASHTLAQGAPSEAHQPAAPSASATSPTSPTSPTSATSANDHCPPPVPALTQKRVQQLMAHPQNRGLLWKVEHGKQSAWLYGTVHAGREAYMVHGPVVHKALLEADSVALELNMLDPKVIKALQDGMRQPPNAPALPAALQRRLDRQNQAACVPEQATQMRPDAQIISLGLVQGQHQGIRPEYGVDMAVAHYAQAMGKPVYSLETPEQQLRVLISDDPKKVQDVVEKGLRQLEAGDVPAQIEKMLNAWERGDGKTLAAYPQWCNCIVDDVDRADMKRLNEDRNPGMAKEIMRLMASGKRPFVAVGSLHLLGEQSIPQLLEARGMKVQRVPLPVLAPAKSAP